MSTTIELFEDELSAGRAIIAAKKENLDLYLPNVIVGIVMDGEESIAEYTERFWPEKCKSYFPNHRKPDNINHKDFFKTEFNNLLAKVNDSGYALKDAGDAAKNNIEIVLAAVNNISYALHYAGDTAKNNIKIVLAAVEQKGYALMDAGDTAKDNPLIVRAAMRQDPTAIQFASQRIQQNPKLLNPDSINQRFRLFSTEPSSENKTPSKSDSVCSIS